MERSSVHVERMESLQHLKPRTAVEPMELRTAVEMLELRTAVELMGLRTAAEMAELRTTVEPLELRTAVEPMEPLKQRLLHASSLGCRMKEFGAGCTQSRAGIATHPAGEPLFMGRASPVLSWTLRI